MRKFIIPILCGIAALVLFGTHIAYAQAVPDPVADPLAAISTLQKLYASGAFVDVGILVAFFGLTIASSRIAWLQTDHHAVYVSAALGGLALLVAPASQGTTPNLQMLLGAVTVAVALALNPKKPAENAVVRGDLPVVAAMPKALVNGGTTLVLLVALALGASQLTACGASQQQTTLTAALATTDAARAAFLAYDAKHQADIVSAAKTKDDGAAALAVWRKEQDMARIIIDSAYRAIAAYSVLKDDPTSLQNLNSALGMIVSEFAAIGIK